MSLLAGRADDGPEARANGFAERVPGGDDFDQVEWKMSDLAGIRGRRRHCGHLVIFGLL